MLIIDTAGHIRVVCGRPNTGVPAVHRRKAKQALTIILSALDGLTIGEEELAHARRLLTEFVELR
jgi:hypothetical protein